MKSMASKNIGRYEHGRPKGWAEWKPQAETSKVLSDILDVLETYKEHKPLTVRQIFYRLVAQTGYGKTENKYRCLCEYLVKARRSKIIAFEDIRDDGITSTNPPGWESPHSFIEAIKYHAESYSRDKQQRQTYRVIVLVEAAGMVPQIERIANDFGITVYSSSGFDSVTAKYKLSQAIESENRQTVVLHIGDYDPSGQCIADSAEDDIRAFLDDSRKMIFKRILITPEQIADFNLPTAPAKKTDRRGNGIIETCQAEALAPDVLARIVRSAIEEYIDFDVYNHDLQQEQAEKNHLVGILNSVQV